MRDQAKQLLHLFKRVFVKDCVNKTYACLANGNSSSKRSQRFYLVHCFLIPLTDSANTLTFSYTNYPSILFSSVYFAYEFSMKTMILKNTLDDP